jgi:hypothetical protein
MLRSNYNPIDQMIRVARDDGVDVLRQGIPIGIFTAEWESQYGADFPIDFLEEIEREYVRDGCISVQTATLYWKSLDSWFIDNLLYE